VSQRVSCSACRCYWFDLYELVAVLTDKEVKAGSPEAGGDCDADPTRTPSPELGRAACEPIRKLSSVCSATRPSFTSCANVRITSAFAIGPLVSSLPDRVGPLSRSVRPGRLSCQFRLAYGATIRRLFGIAHDFKGAAITDALLR